MNNPEKYLIQISSITVVAISLYYISIDRYLLFHGLIECFSIMVAFAVFAVGWNSEKYSKSNFFMIIGVAYLFVGFIDLIHTFAYAGMGVFPEFDANLPTQLWIAARYLEAFSILSVWLLRNMKLDRYLVFSSYLIISSLLFLLIFLGIFPACWVEGQGLTLFKIVSEYIIIGLISVSLILLHRYRHTIDESFRRLLTLALILTILAELSFTLYVDVYGIANMVGHYFKLLSFSFIYLSLVRGSLDNPYQVLFRELEISREAEVERAEELTILNKELEGFASAVSHDIRGPLSNIVLSAELLEQQISDDSNREYIQDILDNSKRALKIAENLLRLARISQKPIVLSNVNISKIAESILTRLHEKNPETEYSAKIQPNMMVMCDNELIEIAIDNLLSNAWKFSSNKPRIEIEFGIEYQEHDVVFFLRDNGIGFDMAYSKRIFEPFQRAINSDYDGTGIGLTIVERIIRAHSGRIWAESVVGKGTVFYFTLGILKG